MFKKEVQGHGSIKKLRTGAVVSVLALSVAGGVSVVSADETSSANTTAGNVEVVAKILQLMQQPKHLLLQR